MANRVRNRQEQHSLQSAMRNPRTSARSSQRLRFALDDSAELQPSEHEQFFVYAPLSSRETADATARSQPWPSISEDKPEISCECMLLGQDDHDPAASTEHRLSCIGRQSSVKIEFEEPTLDMNDSRRPPADPFPDPSTRARRLHELQAGLGMAQASPKTNNSWSGHSVQNWAMIESPCLDTFRSMVSQYRHSPSAFEHSQAPRNSTPCLETTTCRRMAPRDMSPDDQVPGTLFDRPWTTAGPGSTSPRLSNAYNVDTVHIADLSDSMSDVEPLFILGHEINQRVPLPEARKLPSPSTQTRRATRYSRSPASDSSPVVSNPGQTLVTLATLENPRSIMALDELEVLLAQRDLPRRAMSEDHAQLVARLHEIDNSLSGKELNALLKEAYLPVSFPKTEKVRHLQKHDAENSRKGLQGIKSTDPVFKQSYDGYMVHGITI